MEQAYLQTPLGVALLKGDESGLKSITVADGELTEEYASYIPDSLQPAAEQLSAYFAGDRRDFQLKLNPEGTAFQKKVWQALREIPYGKTVSYLELSKTLGDAKSIRAVAAANGKNPLWVVVPCHRVIGSDGSLTGYAGGLHRKKWLLDHESPVKQVQLFS